MSRCLCIKTEEGWVRCEEHEKHWPHTPTATELTKEILASHGILLGRLDSVGIKHDQGKPDLSLLPREFLEEVAKAFMHGEKKYGRYNFRNGLDYSRVTAAALRHISAFNEGEDIDSESGLTHLGHAGACIGMLLVYVKNGLGRDTRYKANSEQPIVPKKEIL